jgi:hypothetical protein
MAATRSLLVVIYRQAWRQRLLKLASLRDGCTRKEFGSPIGRRSVSKTKRVVNCDARLEVLKHSEAIGGSGRRRWWAAPAGHPRRTLAAPRSDSRYY